MKRIIKCILLLFVTSQPFIIKANDESDTTLDWRNVVESEDIFTQLNNDSDISLLSVVSGTRIAKYNKPKFGYITKLDLNDGYIYYCIDPYTLLVYGDGYEGSVINFDKISFDTWLLIGKIISYGYGYNGQNDDKYFIATQLMIWDILGYQVGDIYDLSGNLIDTTSEKEIINNNVNSISIKPSFESEYIKCDFNQVCSVKDNNNVLNTYYEIDYSGTSKNFVSGYPYINSNNEIVTKIDKLYEIDKQVRVKSKSGGYYQAIEAMLLMSKAGSQDLLAAKLPDAIEDATVKFGLNRNNLILNKVNEYNTFTDSDTYFQIAYDKEFKHLILPDCDIDPISETDANNINYSQSCTIYNDSKHRFETVNAQTLWKVDSKGLLSIINVLPKDGYSTVLNTQPGQYWIREINTSYQYQLNNDVYSIDLSKGSYSDNFANLLADVSLNIIKTDKDDNNILLDGARYEVFEIFKDNENIEDIVNAKYGLLNDNHYPINTDLTPYYIDYETLITLLPEYKLGDIFIYNDVVYKILNINDNNIEVGFISDIKNTINYSYNMLDNVQAGQMINIDNKDYKVLGLINNHYVLCDEDNIYIVNNYSDDISYQELIKHNGQIFTYNNNLYQCIQYDDLTAKALVYEKNYIDVNGESYIKLDDLLDLINNDSKCEDEKNLIGQTITFKDIVYTIEDVKYNDDNISELKLSYLLEHEFSVKRDYINDINLQDKINQEYQYTLLEKINPSYEFTGSYNNEELLEEVDDKKTDGYLLYEDVENIYPWQTNLISIGDKIIKSYTKIIHPNITLDIVKDNIDIENKKICIDDLEYGINDIKYDEDNNIESVEIIINEQNITVDANNSLEEIKENYSIEWTCSKVNYPSFRVRFDSGYDNLFTNFPIHKNAVLHFVKSDDQFGYTYINYDTNKDGIIDINHGYEQEIINTHPVYYDDLSSIWNLDINETFSIFKQRDKERQDSYISNDIQVYIQDIKDDGNIYDLILCFDANAPDYKQALLSDTYQIVDNINETNILSIKDEQGNIYRYYQDEYSYYQKEELIDNRFNDNTFNVQIEDLKLASYKEIFNLLNDENIPLEAGTNKEIEYLNNLYNIELVTCSDDLIIIKDIDNNNEYTYYNENSLLDRKYFLKTGSSIDLKEILDYKEDVIYTISNNYLDNSYFAYLQDSKLTATKSGYFNIDVILPQEILIDKNIFLDAEVNDTFEIDNTIYTIVDKNNDYIEYKDDSNKQYFYYLPPIITMEQINQINKEVPLVVKGYFEFDNQQYEVSDINIVDNIIDSITIINCKSKEQYYLSTYKQKQSEVKGYIIDTLHFFSEIDYGQQDFYFLDSKNIFTGVTGNSYLRVTDSQNHNFPLSNILINIYEDSEGLYKVGSYTSDNWGVIDVSFLDDGVYYYDTPYNLIAKEFTVKKEKGSLKISDLKWGKTYKACEVELPAGYDLDENQNVCFDITLDQSSGYIKDIKSSDFIVTNKLRTLDLLSFKVDSDNYKKLLNGAVYTFTDVTNQYLDYCQLYNCEYDMPMLYTPEYLDTILSGGIYIKEVEDVFINPVGYTDILEFYDTNNLQIDVGSTFKVDNKEYKITKIWFKNTDNQHILYTDGIEEYNASLDELEYETNYKQVAKENVAYEFSQDENFTDSILAFSDVNGEIKFIPVFDNKYKDGNWYYRKVDIEKEVITLDCNESNCSHLKDEQGKCYQENNKIIGTYQTQTIDLQPGSLRLKDIDYGHDIQICEIASPSGYIKNEVCTTVNVTNEYSLSLVNHYLPDKAYKLKVEKKRKAKKYYKYQFKKLSEQYNSLQYYQNDYLYKGI